MATINKCIENLLFYAKENLFLCPEDITYARNQLYELFKVSHSYEFADKADLQDDILNPMIEYAINNGIIERSQALLFETKIMGLVTPSPGLTVSEFNRIAEEYNIQKATEYLYKLAVNSNYIKMRDIKKNIRWLTKGPRGEVGITINLAKPEKDPKQVLAEKEQSDQGKYPKCALCLENLGYSGSLTHPARQTLRYIPITLNGEDWHLQYSPFVYYDEHCIALSDKHVPMKIDENAFAKLLDFVSCFPHYFMGSNADLPIVGGSILSHDHYQGGKKVLPMFFRPLKKKYRSPDGVTVGIRDWYNSVVHISSKNKFKVLDCAAKVLKKWQGYSNEKIGILCYTDAPHNTITPIASINNYREYCLDLILRNNRTDDKHPYGIYHPTEDMHNIKKEGIGLIEAMGLFILPGRLKSEINEMINVLTADSIDFKKLNDSPSLSKHMGIIAQLANDLGKGADKKAARNAVIEYINKTCIKILECTAVFKDTKEGETAFDAFMNSLNL